MLANKQTLIPLLRFFEKIEIGVQKGARKQLVEWKRKKQLSRQRPAWINSETEYPNVAFLLTTDKIK